MRFILFLFIIPVFLWGGQKEDFSRIEKLCKEHSYRLCLNRVNEFNKKYTEKVTQKRKLRLYEGIAQRKRYKGYQAIKTLRPFIADQKNDALKAEGLYHLMETMIYQYGLYNKKYRKEIITALKQYLKVAPKIKKRKKRLEQLLYLQSRMDSYYTYKGVKKMSADIDKVLKKNLKLKGEFARYYYQKGYRQYHRNYSDKKRVEKALKSLKTVLDEFSKGEYYFKALYLVDSIYQGKRDYVTALKYLKAGQKKTHLMSKHLYKIGKKIAEITDPQLQVYSNYTFLPNNNVQVSLSYRNQVKKGKLNLYRVKGISKYLKKHGGNSMNHIKNIESKDKKRVTVISRKFKNIKKYKHYSETIKLGKLKPGVYLLEGTSNGKSASTIINVTEHAMVLKVGPDKGMAFVAHAITGEPIAKAKISVVLRRYNYKKSKYINRTIPGITNEMGVFKFDIKLNKKHYYAPNVFAVSEAKGNTSFSNGYGGYYYWNYSEQYSAYSFTDRPAYRPGEKVQFKAFVRKYKDGVYTVPDETMTVRINNPKGQKVYEQKHKLDKFGTIDGRFDTKKDFPLGQYSLYIIRKNNQYIYRSYGYFRVEEYKLPEFKLNIQTKKDIYKPGDKIKVEIDAKYYFGGDVKDAKGEVLVYEQPFRHYYSFPRPYYWYYNNWQKNRNPYAAYGSYKGKLLKTYKIKTGKNGKAYIEVPTKSIAQITKELEKQYGSHFKNWMKNPFNNNAPQYQSRGKRRYRRHYNNYYYNYRYSFDRKYHIEVRLTDKSRREITGSSDLKVTQKPFYAYIKPKKYVFTPKEKINIEIKTINANSIPVETEGTLKVLKSYYDKKEKKYGYKEVKSLPVYVPKKDRFIFTFTLDNVGAYHLVFESKYGKEMISASAHIYLSNDQYARLYRDQNLEIIPEKDHYSPDEKARVLITTKYPDAFVLLTIEGESIFKQQIEYIKAGSKIVYLPLNEHMTPNVTIKAALITNLSFFEQQKEIIIPPLHRFITVEVEKSKEQYLPGEEATFTVTTKNYKGEPIPAQVALGIVDQSVYYIQPDYAPDILKFYYANRKRMSINTTHSFSYTRYYNKDGGVKNKLTINELQQQTPKTVTTEASMDSIATGSSGFGGRGALGRAKSAPRPMASRSPMKKSKRRSRGKKEMKKMDFDDGAKAPGGKDQATKKPDFSNVKIRTDFRSTAHWSPSIVTGKDGKGTITMKFPENLTGWQITARGIDETTRVGSVKTTVRTKKELLVRLQAPRFFLERDRVTLSGNIHNYGSQVEKIDVRLKVEGGLKPLGKGDFKLELKPGEDKRVDLTFDVIHQGEAKITLLAKTKTKSDAMTLTFPIKPYGMLQQISRATTTMDGGVVTIKLPADRRKSSTKLSVSISPSIAAIMIKSLSYLAKYPYGCVEQTMSRFLPTVVAVRAAQNLGLDPETIKKDMDQMVKKGLKRLYDFQHSNGGWGWWKRDRFNLYMTAYVIYGLTMAQQTDIAVDQNVLKRGFAKLKAGLKNRSDDYSLHHLAYGLYALSFSTQTVSETLKYVYDKRDKLNAYSKALLAITMANLGKVDEGKILLRNMEDHVVVDKENKTAHYGKRNYWYWYHGDVESTSFALRAYLKLRPDHKRVPQMLKWLVFNRVGNRWKHTKETAHAIYALTDYLNTIKEMSHHAIVEVLLNGNVVKKISLTKENLLKSLDGTLLTFYDKDLKTGKNIISIRDITNRKEPIYLMATLNLYTKEEEIKANGFEVFIKRRYNKIKPIWKDGKVVGKKSIPVKNGAVLKSGERVEVTLDVTSKNNYTYFMIDDFKPAGMEPTRLTSGSSQAGGTYANMEVRDDRTVFFITYLSKGKHTLKYELRAETPGIFHSLPAKVEAMYVPRLKGNSKSTLFKIKDQ